MHQPVIYRSCLLPADAVSLWVEAAADLFIDAAPNPDVTGFPDGAQTLRVRVQCTGGTAYMQMNGEAAASGYGMLLADGVTVDVPVPYTKLSFIKLANTPTIRLFLIGAL